MYIGIDIGASNIRVGLFEENSSIHLLKTKSFSVDNDFDKSLHNIVKAIKELVGNKKLSGIGSTLNGIVDTKKGLIKDCANLRGWIEKPFAETLKKEFDTEVRVDNDMVVAALGEHLYGYGQGLDKFMYIVWGTGFGAAFVEKIEEKVKVNQIEAGHQILVWHGRKCLCGQKGCAEAYIGGKSAEELYGKPLSEITDENTWNEVAKNAAHALINTLNHYPSNLLVFGGGVVNKQQHLLPKIKSLIKGNMTLLESPELKMSKLCENIGTYGAAGLFFVERV